MPYMFNNGNEKTPVNPKDVQARLIEGWKLVNPKKESASNQGITTAQADKEAELTEREAELTKREAELEADNSQDTELLELREKAKDLKISGFNLMKKETLTAKIAEKEGNNEK